MRYLMAALDTALGAGAAGPFLQAIAFGILHLHDSPNGVPGLGLAFGNGFMLGGLRRKAGDLAAPLAVHVLTDLVIAGMVLAVAHP